MTPSRALMGYEAAKRGQWEVPAYNKQRQKKDNAKERRKIIRARQLDFNEKEFPEQDQAPPVTFRRGDKVMVKENNPAGPFAPTWDGPYEIILRWSPQIYEVDKKGKQYRYHVDQLRPAPEGNPVVPEDLQSDPEDPQDGPDNSGVSYSEDEEPPPPIATRAIVHQEPFSRVERRPAGTEVEHCVPSPPGKSDTDRDRFQATSDQTIRNAQPRNQPINPPLQSASPAALDQQTSVVILRRPRRRSTPRLTTSFQGFHISTGIHAVRNERVRGNHTTSETPKDDLVSP